MRAQNENNDEDLNRKRFDELKKEHQQQQEKFKETKNQLESLETQVRQKRIKQFLHSSISFR